MAQSEDPNDHMHCAWLCISEDSRRVKRPSQAAQAARQADPVVVSQARAVMVSRRAGLLEAAMSSAFARFRRPTTTARAWADGRQELIEWTCIVGGSTECLGGGPKGALHLKSRAHFIVAGDGGRRNRCVSDSLCGCLPYRADPDFDARQHHFDLWPSGDQGVPDYPGEFDDDGRGGNPGRAFPRGQSAASRSRRRTFCSRGDQRDDCGHVHYRVRRSAHHRRFSRFMRILETLPDCSSRTAR